MMGSRQEAQGALFYEFSIEAHVPSDHTLRSVDQFVDLASIRQHLAPFYSSTGRPPGMGACDCLDARLRDFQQAPKEGRDTLWPS